MKPDCQDLIEKLSQACNEDAIEAAKTLSYLHHEDCIPSLIEFVKSQQPSYKRELALHALAGMHNPQLIDTFIQVLRNPDEMENVRGQAAEALGMLFDCNSGHADDYHKVEQVLLKEISDSSPIVRFWCCYGLGNMRSHRAIEQLKALRQDYVLCPGWWYVSEEAEDALARIAGLAAPDRVPVHLRSL